MAIDFNKATPDYLFVDSAPTNSEIGTIAVRAKCDDDNPAADQYHFFFGDSGNAADYHGLAFRTSGVLYFFIRNAGVDVSTVGDYADGDWHSMVGTWDDTFNGGAGCEIFWYVDGESLTDTISSGQSRIENYDRVAFGMLRDNSPGSPFDGKAADIAMWDVILTPAEAAIYIAGYSPLFIRPQSLVAYWPLIRPTYDIIGGLTMTAGGSPVVSAHQPIIYPANVRVGIPEAAAPPTGNPWYQYAQEQ
jgi:hypothetical protein